MDFAGPDCAARALLINVTGGEVTMPEIFSADYCCDYDSLGCDARAGKGGVGRGVGWLQLTLPGW